MSRRVCAAILVGLFGCAPSVDIVEPGEPAPSSGSGAGGHASGVGGVGSVASGTTATASTSSSSGAGLIDCTPTCSGAGDATCACARPCGDFEMHPERVECSPAVGGDKVICTCVVEEVVAGVCYET